MSAAKIAVFGAGAIGCWLGGRLAAAGVDVALIGRPAVMAEAARGLTLSELDGPTVTVVPRVATAAAAARDADLVIVTVKSPATAAAAAELAPILGERAVLASFQNGVRNPGVLREALPGRTVLAGMVPYNVARVAAGHYRRATTGVLAIDAGTTPAARAAAAALVAACGRAGLAIEARADITAVQWGKLVMNLNNAINALSGVPLAAELADRDFRRCLAAAQREALDVLAAARLPVARTLALPPRLIARLLPMPDWAFRRLAGRIAGVDRAARSSMADDLAAGRATEIDDLQGEIVAVAERAGVAAPVNRRLAALVRAAERGGKRAFTGAELRAALA